MNQEYKERFKKLDKYIMSNLKTIEKFRFKLLLFAFDYKSCYHYLEEINKDFFKLNLQNLSDNFVHMEFEKKRKRLKYATLFTPLRFLKKHLADFNKDMFNITHMMSINFSKNEYDLSNLQYRSYLNENLKILEYLDFRYKRFKFFKSNSELRLYRFIKLELKNTEDLIELESKNIEYKKYFKYKFLEKESVLNSLCIELVKTGFINNVSDFLEFFTRSKEIPYIVTTKKINWNKGLVSLAYLFVRMTEIGFLDVEILSKIHVKISGLFTYKNNQPIDNKVMGNAKNRIRSYETILEGKVVPTKNNNLMIIYRILEKFDLSEKI